MVAQKTAITLTKNLYAWIKKKQKPATYAKISPKMTNPRDIAGNAEEEEKKKKEEEEKKEEK